MDTQSQLEQLKILQSSDHDALVRIESKQDIFNKTMGDEIKGMRVDISGTLADHEGRLRAQESKMDNLDPVQIKADIIQLKKDATTNKINWKAIAIIGGILTIVIGAAIPIIVALINKH